jgi:hypothetical protein
MDHISGNKIRIESIKVPIDREDRKKSTVRVCLIAIFTDVAGLQSEKMPKRGTKGSR